MKKIASAAAEPTQEPSEHDLDPVKASCCQAGTAPLGGKGYTEDQRPASAARFFNRPPRSPPLGPLSPQSFQGHTRGSQRCVSMATGYTSL